MAYKLAVSLDVFSQVPLYLQLAAQIKLAIENGRLAPGERLPSIRDLAKQLQLSQCTIREAFDKLVSWELVIARPGSGNYVAGKRRAFAQPENGVQTRTARCPNPAAAGEFEPLARAVRWSVETYNLSESRELNPLNTISEISAEFDFRPGAPSSNLLKGTRWDRLISNWARDCASNSPGYSDARGLLELRVELADWLRCTRGINCSADDLIVTSGAQQARDLVARLFVSPGTEVLVEEPVCTENLLAYAAQGARFKLLPKSVNDLSTSNLDRLAPVKVAHLATTANLISGTSLSQASRQTILDWAAAHQVFIVEESQGAGMHYAPITPTIFQLAKAQGREDLIVYHGSLSELLMPSIRLGFAIVPSWLQKSYFRAKWLSERHPSILSQQLLLALLKDGFLDDHLRKLARSASIRRDSLLAALRKWPEELIELSPTQAGMRQAVWLKDNLDDSLVCSRALTRGVGVMPVSPCFIQGGKRSGLSLAFARLPEQQITQGMTKLLSVVLDCRSQTAL
jgi:GntR family transcriptional regulator/MocR family aminotransferase